MFHKSPEIVAVMADRAIALPMEAARNVVKHHESNGEAYRRHGNTQQSAWVENRFVHVLEHSHQSAEVQYG